MKVLYSVLLGVLVVIVAISFVLKGESTHFYGVAESMEIVVNSENPVEIKKIHVVQGQAISRGDTLIELISPELDIKISAAQAELGKLKTEQATRIAQLRAEIQQLKAQYELNKKLTAGLKSIPQKNTVSGSDARNPIKLQIAALQRELHLALQASKTQSDKSNSQVQLQAEQLQNELELLLESRSKLLKISPINGIIGSINFKEGEKISPYTPVLTLHTKSPSFIKGYIHENVYNKIEVGQKVRIHSMSDKSNHIQGEVVGVGSRIVEYPVRLRKRQDFQIWGREVVIKIPPENTFLLGEKVLITSSRF